MSAMKVGVVLLGASCVAGCGVGTVTREPPKVLFPKGAYGDPAPRVACFESAQQFVQQKARVVEGPAAVPGDDARPLVLSVRDQSRELDVEAMEVLGVPFSGRVLFAGTASDTRFADGISVYPGPRAQLEISFLLRSAVRGGLFEHLTFCYRASLFMSVRPDDSSLVIVVSDQPNQPPRMGPLIVFDPPRFESPLPGRVFYDDPVSNELGPVDALLTPRR